MADHLIHLPSNWRFVPQFDGGSQYKCVEACLVMAGQVAYPDRYPHPAQLMSQIYEKYVGPDVPADRNGTNKQQAMDWLQSQHIGYIDMQHLIGGDMEELRKEISAQNLQGVCQIISVSDESHLKYARNGQSLHNWADEYNHGSHAFLRLGFSDSDGWAYYAEPAAAPQFKQPVPIMWNGIVAGGINGCIAIMPKDVDVPPAGFSFQHAQWPIPPAKVNVDEAVARINTVEQALQAAIAALNVAKGDLGKQ